MKTFRTVVLNTFVQKLYIMKIIKILLCTCLFINCQNQKTALITIFNIKINSNNITDVIISKYDIELEKMTELKSFDSIFINNTYAIEDQFMGPAIYEIKTNSGQEIRIAVEKNGLVEIQLGDEIKLESEIASVSDFQQIIQKLNNQYFEGMIADFDKAMKENDQVAIIELEKKKDKILLKFIEAMENTAREMGASALAFDALPYFDMSKNHDFIVEMAEQFKLKYPDSEMYDSLQLRIDNAAKLSIGKIAPEFKAKNLKGSIINLSDFSGNYVLLDFWATWCRPCRIENPKLVKLHKEFGETGFDIISISIDKDIPTWENAIEEDGMEWNQILNSDYSIYKLYALSSLPSNLLLDSKGKIIAKNITADQLKDKLEIIFSGHVLNEQ